MSCDNGSIQAAACILFFPITTAPSCNGVFGVKIFTSNCCDISEFIVGTQTGSTAIFVGKSRYLTSLTDGTQITYWLPYGYSSSDAYSYTPTGGSSAVGAALRLTFNDNTFSKKVFSKEL